MDNTISIDFGTTRTKLAHFSLLTKKPELMRFQKDDPFIPSLFYLFRDNDQILFGHDAEEMLEEDPAGIIAVLKRHLKDTYVRANRKRKSPGEMLLFLFTKLRELAGKEIPAFEGNPPRKVILTIPVLYGPPEERLLRDAASHAGFEEVELLPEPVAAARAWLAETGERSKEVIVFDCGGGTIDWAYLRRENGDFRVIPDCPPGGDRCVGGHDIDNELLDLLKDKLPEELHGEIEEKAPYYLQQVRTVKERYCRGRSVRPLRIGSTQVALHEDQDEISL
jgi:molecular chaperone DnaK (HSP70)